MSTPTYAQTLLVPTIAEEEADLLARFTASQLAGWPPEAPQRQLLTAEAQALQFEMLQRAIIAYASTPIGLFRLRSFLIAQGYSATDAASITSAWVDVALEWYATLRIQATKAQWSVAVKSTTLTTIDATSNILVQADDGTIFVSTQTGAAVVLNSGNSYKGVVTFTARNAGTSGNVVPGTITHVMSGPAGLQIDSGGSQTLLVAARDAQSDEDALRVGLAKWPRRGAGWTRDAYDALIVQAAPTVTRWRVDDSNPFGPGTVGVYIANAAGPATVQEVAAVDALLNGRSVRPLGTGGAGVLAATADPLTVHITVKGDGSNASLAANIASALTALAGPYTIGPAILALDRVRAAALGDAMSVIDVDDGSGNVTQLAVNLPGFRGAVSITSCDLVADHAVPSAQVLVMTPVVTVV